MKENKILSILCILTLSVFLSACGGSGDDSLDRSNSNENVNENINDSDDESENESDDNEKSFSHYLDETYDKSKLVPYSHDRGKIYNILDIHISEDHYSSLSNKKSFTDWLQSKTHLHFTHKVTRDYIIDYQYWRVEFPYATIEEVDALDKDLEKTDEVAHTSKITLYLPEYDTPEYRKRMQKLHSLEYNEGSLFDDPRETNSSGSWHFEYLGLNDIFDENKNSVTIQRFWTLCHEMRYFLSPDSQSPR
ncbi:MAG: hypothetical protein AAFP10_04870, partial [Pseudomonadota bacterium]